MSPHLSLLPKENCIMGHPYHLVIIGSASLMCQGYYRQKKSQNVTALQRIAHSCYLSVQIFVKANGAEHSGTVREHTHLEGREGEL
jgi:hypothetical protein